MANPAIYVNKFFGVNSNLAPHLIKDYEARDILNMDIDYTGKAITRSGYVKYNSTAITGTPTVERIYKYYKEDGTSKFLASTSDGNIYYADGTDNFTSTILTGATDNDWIFDTFKDKCFFTNADDGIKKYDGTNVTTLGVEVPVVTGMAATKTGTGTFGGNYKYKVTFYVDAYEEGEASAAVSVDYTTADAASIELSGIPTGEADTTARKIYRTTDGGSVYYLLATISDNTTTTYSDTTADADLDITESPPSDAGLPVSDASFVLEHKEHLFINSNANPNRIYMSYLDEPDIWPSTYWIDFAPGDGDTIVGAAKYIENLYIFKHHSIYSLIGRDIDTWETSRSPVSNYGTESAKSLQVTDRGILYLNRDGVFLFNGTTTTRVSYWIDDKLESITLANKRLSVSSYKDHKYYLSFPSESKIYVLDFDLYIKGSAQVSPWTIYDYSVNDFSVWENGNIYGAGGSGQVYQLNSGTNDDGTAIDAYYNTKYLDGGNIDIYKNFREMILHQNKSFTGTVTIGYDLDYGNISGSFTQAYSSQYEKRFSLPLGVKGRIISLKFEDNVKDEAIDLSSYVIRFKPLRRR